MARRQARFIFCVGGGFGNGGGRVATEHQAHIGREHNLQREQRDDDLFQPTHNEGIKASRPTSGKLVLPKDCVTIRPR